MSDTFDYEYDPFDVGDPPLTGEEYKEQLDDDLEDALQRLPCK